MSATGQGAFGRHECVKPVGPGAAFGQTCGKPATHHLPFTGPHAEAMRAALGLGTTWCAEHVAEERPSDRRLWVKIGK